MTRNREPTPSLPEGVVSIALTRSMGPYFRDPFVWECRQRVGADRRASANKKGRPIGLKIIQKSDSKSFKNIFPQMTQILTDYLSNRFRAP